MDDDITVQLTVSANIEKVWEYWTKPEHIVNWNYATDEWMCPRAVNNLEPNGKFSWRMEAKDGSMGFDYSGTCKEIKVNKLIKLTLDGGREVSISFTEQNGLTKISETFEPDENDVELQRQGWQAILNTFKKYVETN